MIDYPMDEQRIDMMKVIRNLPLFLLPMLSYDMFYLKTFLFISLTLALAPIYILILLVLYPWRLSIGPRLVRLYSIICLLIYRVKIDKVLHYKRFAKTKNGFLIVANHSSFLDIFVLSSLFQTAFVSKAEVMYYPIIGQIAWLMGVVFFDRRSSRERRRVLKTIANKYEGRTISVFPQGTTGRISDRLPFQRGIFRAIELNPEMRLLPVTLNYKEDQMIAWHNPQSLKENAMKVCEQKTIHLTVDVHRPVTIEDYRGKTTAEVCKMVEGIVLGPLQNDHP